MKTNQSAKSQMHDTRIMPATSEWSDPRCGEDDGDDGDDDDDDKAQVVSANSSMCEPDCAHSEVSLWRSGVAA